MDRRACVDVPALPLQLLVAAHPEWKSLPVAVVDADEPTGTLLVVNAAAWRGRLRPGMRYASALALDGRLRTGTVAARDIDEAVARVTEALRRHTPHVEPSREEAGVFWLDASGLEQLYASADAWTRAVLRAVAAEGLQANVATGFTRFGSYAIAKALEGGVAAAPRRARTPKRHLVCESEEEERRLAGGVALERLGIDPKLRDALARLGIATVGEFARLPPEGIRRRYGEDAQRLHRRARGEAWDPLLPLAPEEPLHRALLLEDPLRDATLLLFLLRRLLGELVATLAARGDAVAAVTTTLHPSLRRRTPPLVFTVRAAEPTLDETVLTDLLRLRLESEARAGLGGATVIEVELGVEAAPAGAEQLRLFHERTKRDLAAGSRALARIRAELGDSSVLRAVPRQGHLPEAGFAWEPMDKLVAPSPRAVLLRPLVRRLYERGIPLPPKPFRERDDCWIPSLLYEQRPPTVRDGNSVTKWTGGTVPEHASGRSERALRPMRIVRSAAHGRVDAMHGPYIVSGGWWNREVHREYHYARTEDGEILWVYYDRQRRRWFLAGKVE